MRIAIVSDIHGNLAALEAVAADIRRRGVDQVVDLGDNVSGPLLPRETASFLMSSGWLTLAGNHERQLLALTPGQGNLSDRYARAQLSDEMLAWLRTLQPSFRLTEAIYLCHGTPRSDCEYLLESLEGSSLRLASPSEIADRLGDEHAAVIACGHTHVARAVRTGNGQLLVNPGSVGLPAYSDDQPVFHAVETGSTDARYAIVEQRAQDWTAQHIALPYDHRSMAALALKNDRPDWAHALLTGYMH